MVTHEPDIAAFADRVITMRDGDYLRSSAKSRTASHTEVGKREQETPMAAIMTPPQLGGAWSFRPHGTTGRLAGAGAQQNALGPDDARYLYWRRRSYRDGCGGTRRSSIRQGANRKPWHKSCHCHTGRTTASGVRGGFGSASTLTVADAEAIKRDDSAVAEVAYQDRQLAQTQYGNQNWSTSIQGISPSYLSIRNWAVIAGRTMTEEDNRNAARVGLIGQTVMKNLFSETENPIGRPSLSKMCRSRSLACLMPRVNPVSGKIRMISC